MFAQSIEQDIFHSESIINKTAIRQLAQSHANILRENLLENTLHELQTNLSDCALYTAAFNLNACFMVAMDYVPFAFQQIAGDDQALCYYIEQIHLCLAKL